MNSPRKIVFIAANPVNSELKPVDWENELKELAVILRKDKRNRFNIDPCPKATTDDLIEALRNNPWLFHFCGHGDSNGNLILEPTEKNKTKHTLDRSVFINTISSLYNLKCTILSSCHSDLLSDDLKEYVDYVICFSGSLENADSIMFTKTLYKNIIHVETIPHAFQRTLDDLKNNNYRSVGNLKPIFKSKNKDAMTNIATYQKKISLYEDEVKQRDLLVSQSNSDTYQLNELLLDLAHQEHPFPNGISWFIDNKDSLVHEISRVIKDGFSNSIQERYHDELDMIFDVLKTSLVIFQDRDFDKNDLKIFKKKSTKQEYYNGLDELLKLLPEHLKSDEFKLFLKDNIEYIKKII